MDRRLTLELTEDEIREAVKEYVIKNTGDKVKEIEILITKLPSLTIKIACETKPPKRVKAKRSRKQLPDFIGES